MLRFIALEFIFLDMCINVKGSCNGSAAYWAPATGLAALYVAETDRANRVPTGREYQSLRRANIVEADGAGKLIQTGPQIGAARGREIGPPSHTLPHDECSDDQRHEERSGHYSQQPHVPHDRAHVANSATTQGCHAQESSSDDP